MMARHELGPGNIQVHDHMKCRDILSICNDVSYSSLALASSRRS